MNKTNKLNTLFSYIFAISIIYFIIVATVYLVCFLDKNMLLKLFDRFHTPDLLPFTLSRENLDLIQRDLMDYLAGKIPFLETEVVANDTILEFYSIRSKIHMGDVRNIFMIMFRLSYLSIILCIISYFKIITSCKKPFTLIKKAYSHVLIVFSVVFIALIVYAVIDFESFFVSFHQILFDNDYWLLDPNIDYIICLLTEEVFVTIGIRLVIVASILLLLFFFILYFCQKLNLTEKPDNASKSSTR